jgi:peptide/bleomycin uptake transporter
MLLWYTGGHGWGEYLGFPKGYAEAELSVGVSRFWESSSFGSILVYSSTGLFAGFWRFFLIINGKMVNLGSAFILFNIWFGVQVSVAINAWYGPFWDLIQRMLTNGGGNIADLYRESMVFLYIAMVAITLAVVNAFLPVIMYSVGGQQ